MIKPLGVAAATALLFGLTAPMASAAQATTHHRLHDGSSWGGYAAQQGGTTVTGSWVNPQLSCAGGDNSLWAGLDGAGNGTVEQIGIDLDCTSGTPAYRPWYEMYPRGSIYFDENTQAGDSMTASVTHNDGPNYTLTLSDSTQNWSKTFTDSLDEATDTTSEVIMERLTDNVDNFGTVNFSGCNLDGQPLGNLNPGKFTISAGNGTEQVGTGDINGDSFAMNWEAAGLRKNNIRPTVHG